MTEKSDLILVDQARMIAVEIVRLCHNEGLDPAESTLAINIALGMAAASDPEYTPGERIDQDFANVVRSFAEHNMEPVLVSAARAIFSGRDKTGYP